MSKFQMNRELEEALRKVNLPEEKIAELKNKNVEAQIDVNTLSLDNLKDNSEVEKIVQESLGKNPDVVKINPEDLEGVSGGGIYGIKKWAPEDWRCACFKNQTWPEGGAFIQAVYDAFGFDVTADFLPHAYNCMTRDWAEKLREGGPYYCAVYMWSIAYSCWIS